MSEWVADEDITRTKLNQKTIVVKSSTPSPIYQGQLWFDTTEGIYKFSPDGSTFKRLGKYLFAVDDTQVSVTGTTETEKKYFRLVKTNYTPFKNIHIILTLWVNGGTGYAKIYIDSETSARLTLSTTSTTEAVLEGDFSISDLSNGIHTIRLKLSNSLTSNITYNEHFEGWGE